MVKYNVHERWGWEHISQYPYDILRPYTELSDQRGGYWARRGPRIYLNSYISNAEVRTGWNYDVASIEERIDFFDTHVWKESVDARF